MNQTMKAIKGRKIMTHRFIATAATALFACLLVPALSAGTIFTNFGPLFTYDTLNGTFIGNDLNPGDNAAEGASFTPATSTLFGSLTIALSCFNNCPVSPFTVSLDSDSSGVPGSAIESFSVTGATLDSNPLITLTSSLNSPLLAGIQYWIAVTTSDANATAGDSIVWNNNTVGDTSAQANSVDGGTTWSSISGLYQTPGAYEVDSLAPTTTPEPGTWGLMIPSIAMLGAIGCQRRKRPGSTV